MYADNVERPLGLGTRFGHVARLAGVGLGHGK